LDGCDIGKLPGIVPECGKLHRDAREEFNNKSSAPYLRSKTTNVPVNNSSVVGVPGKPLPIALQEQTTKGQM